MESMVKEFWKDKKVFVTGHTGFKGGWLVETLKILGANIKGYALAPNTEPSFFDSCDVKNGIISEFGDIRDSNKLESSMSDFNPDIVFHLAAQPLVRYSYEHPKETYEVNVIGTLNVLEAIKKVLNIKAAVLVTTDKCYENKEWDYGYREIDPMGGYDPYSSSKGCCELLISSYRNSYFNNSPTKIASVRAGNVIGGGDWSEDRLVPDILRAISNNESPIIRNPLAVRPWQYVLEPIFGYIKLAEKLYSKEKGFDEAWNFGPNDTDCQSVGWITSELLKIAKKEFSWTQDPNYNPHEAQLLKLDISKAKSRLNWYPRWDINKTLNQIINWHQAFNKDKNVLNITKKQIIEYLDHE
jgi:CDP-glucose 4,6-dehydratase